jgi:hypothetical protein
MYFTAIGEILSKYFWAVIEVQSEYFFAITYVFIIQILSALSEILAEYV